jgi:hypothetical protein
MRTAAAASSMSPVAGRRQVILEVDSGSEPLTGRMRCEDGATVEFAGWLEFAAALERLQRGDGCADDDGRQ